MFKALEAQYNNISSSTFNLKLVLVGEGGGVKTQNLGIPFTIEEDKVKRVDKPFFFGVEVNPKLQFTLQFAYLPENEANKILTRESLNAINKWLCQREYKEFKIIDPDYSGIIYNCMFTNPRQIEIANFPMGIEVDVICDRPYGFKRQTITKNVTTSLTFDIINQSGNNAFIYPEFEITTTGNFSIINNTDSGRSSIFTGLSANETVYVNNELNTIYSSTGLNRNPNFNFNWFRIVPKYKNNITLIGNGTVKFRIEYPMGV